MKYGYTDYPADGRGIASREYVAESDLGVIPPPIVRRSYINEETGNLEVTTYQEEALETEGHRLARMKVEHPAEIPWGEFGDEDSNSLVMDTASGARSFTDRKNSLSEQLRSKAYMTKDEADEFIRQQDSNPQMFVHRPAIITDAITHTSMKPSIATLGALATRDFKGDIMASPDLSEHSSRLTRKAMAAGLVKPHPANPTATAVNDIDFDDPEFRNEFPDTRFEDDSPAFKHEISHQEARAARAKALELYIGRPRNLSTQFDSHIGEQMEFPQTEDKYYGEVKFKDG